MSVLDTGAGGPAKLIAFGGSGPAMTIDEVLAA
jgi:hypothetical protein